MSDEEADGGEILKEFMSTQNKDKTSNKVLAQTVHKLCINL